MIRMSAQNSGAGVILVHSVYMTDLHGRTFISCIVRGILQYSPSSDPDTFSSSLTLSSSSSSSITSLLCSAYSSSSMTSAPGGGGATAAAVPAFCAAPVALRRALAAHSASSFLGSTGSNSSRARSSHFSGPIDELYTMDDDAFGCEGEPGWRVRVDAS